MGKFAKCPYCGDAPVTWGDDYGDIHIQCCDMHTTSGRKWNQYAAAMELAKAAVWADECEEQKDFMDDTVSNRDAWRSIVNLDLDANDKACEAHECVLEVFGDVA